MPWQLPLRAAPRGVRFLSSSNYDDEKLRQIIETSNVGIAQRLKDVKVKVDDQKMKPQKSEPIKKTNLEATVGADSSPAPMRTAKVNADKPLHPESPIAKALLSLIVDSREALTVVARTLNEMTGYSTMEKLKLLVGNLEQLLSQAKKTLKSAKVEYAEAIQKRSDLQKEINELLTRKHNWTPIDVERFTELYKNDHINQQQEQAAERRLEAADQNVDSIQNQLTQLILTRYHEEQLWSDKIRQVLTWGTWLLTGVNVLLFIVSAFFLEPWKRRRLVDAFQKEMQVKVDEFSDDIKNISEQITVITGSQVKQNKESDTKLQDERFFQFKFTNIRNWEDVKRWCRSVGAAVKNPQIGTYLMEKVDFAIFSGALVALGWIFGSAFSYLLK